MTNDNVGRSRLGELAAKLRSHEHLCLIYNSREEQLAAALPFLKAGLERGEKCIYVAEQNSAPLVLDALHKAGPMSTVTGAMR